MVETRLILTQKIGNEFFFRIFHHSKEFFDWRRDIDRAPAEMARFVVAEHSGVTSRCQTVYILEWHFPDFYFASF